MHYINEQNGEERRRKNLEIYILRQVNTNCIITFAAALQSGESIVLLGVCLQHYT